MGRAIYFCDVVISYYKGKSKKPVRMRSWVIGGGDTPGKINTDQHMMGQIMSRVYDDKYKGVRKCMVVEVVSVKFLGNSFYY
mgnify:CR=1 FL=1|jgi:NADPH-dependent glutamate synthase beta subunit-like oxidoreductase